MAAHGSVGAFDRDAEDWTSYCERVEQYLAANTITNAERRKAVFLSVCGPATYKLLSPDKLADKTLEQLVKLVGDHLTPKLSIIVQRFHFHSRIKRVGVDRSVCRRASPSCRSL